MNPVGSGAFVLAAFPVPAGSERMGRDWVPVLKELPLFAGMSIRHLRRDPARAKPYGPGETIVRAGDPTRWLGALAVDPAHPGTVYVGGGEAPSSRPPMGAGPGRRAKARRSI
jgi:hypothetical protein